MRALMNDVIYTLNILTLTKYLMRISMLFRYIQDKIVIKCSEMVYNFKIKKTDIVSEL